MLKISCKKKPKKTASHVRLTVWGNLLLSLPLPPCTCLLRRRGQGSKKALELPPLGGLHLGLGPEGGFVFSACLSSFNLSLSLSFPPSRFFLSFKFSSNFYQLILKNHLTQCFGEGNGNPLQNSCLEKPMDRGAWRATVHRIGKSQTELKELSRQALNT